MLIVGQVDCQDSVQEIRAVVGGSAGCNELLLFSFLSSDKGGLIIMEVLRCSGWFGCRRCAAACESMLVHMHVDMNMPLRSRRVYLVLALASAWSGL